MENFIYYSVHNITQKAILYSFPQCQSYVLHNQIFYAIVDSQKQNICKINWNKLEPVRYRLASVKAAA